ncbi:MAG TPA: choice-of-anchor Q domain-containing protein [Acidimicrobiales bacterium]|nr:choice-of-anchor Q domain-containing protein [Acidimicrobiales bacterium]
MKLRTDGGRATRRFVATALVLGLAPLSVAMAPGMAAAATRTVTNCNDSGTGSLRKAVLDAASGDTVAFALSPPCPIITLTSTISITRNLTVDGPGSGVLAVSGNDAVGVFSVDPGVSVTLSGLTIEKGSSTRGGGILNDGALTVTKSTVSGNSASTGGGGIWSNGSLTVTDSTLADNATGSYGGGIYSGSNGTLHVTDSTLSGNTATALDVLYPQYAYGGGVYAYGTAAVTGTTVSDNGISAIGGGGGGGGIYVGGTLNVTDSTVSDNHASILFGIVDGDGGGGILNGGTLSVTDSTLSDNTTNVDGGGLDNGGVLSVADSTLSGNSTTAVGGGGGGIFNDGTLTVTAATLADNSADSAGGGIDNAFGGSVAAAATIVAGSTAGGDCSGTMADTGGNLDDDGSCGFTAPSDHPDTPAGLDPAGLESNGGPTRTIALDPDSAAVGAVDDPSLCSTPDQRGEARTTPCDIGAVDLVLIPQTIVFTSTPPSAAVVGGPIYSVSATGGGSGEPVTFAIDASAASVCAISGSTVTFIGEGTCVIDADQSGHAGYSAAAQAQQSFAVGPAAQAITSPDAATTAAGSPFSFTVTTSGSPVPSIAERGRLPRALVFTDNGNGTATVSGVPRKPGTDHVTVTATFGRGKTKHTVTQAFTLTVDPG